MASAPPPIAGDGASREKHSGKVYTRKTLNKTPKSNPQTVTLNPTIRHSEDSAAAAAAAAAASVSVTVTLSFRSKSEARNLRRQLTAELRQVRALYHKFDSLKESSSLSDVITPRQLSVSVMESTGVVSEKEKRTPKANKNYHSSDFLLGNERLKSPDSKKPKSGVESGKLHAQAFKSCSSLLLKIMKHKHGWVFNTPVDAKALGLHDYYIIIKNPMDLGTVKSRLSKNWYKNLGEFAEDVRLTFRNAMVYNPKGQDVHFMAEELLGIFEEDWPAIEAECTYISMLKKPLLGKRLPPTIDMKKVVERSESGMSPKNPLSVESKTKSVSYKPHVGRPPSALKKPKAKDLDKRDMTFEEKKKLSNNLENLPLEKLDNVVQIIRKRNSSLSQNDDEIEVDIDSVDTETLWELDRFVVNYKKSLSKNKRKVELAVHRIAGLHHDLGGQAKVQERNSDPVVVAEVPKESRTVTREKYSAPFPRDGEKKRDNATKSGGSSSSSSDSGSSSDSDSESSASGSDMAQSPRT